MHNQLFNWRVCYRCTEWTLQHTQHMVAMVTTMVHANGGRLGMHTSSGSIRMEDGKKPEKVGRAPMVDSTMQGGSKAMSMG